MSNRIFRDFFQRSDVGGDATRREMRSRPSIRLRNEVTYCAILTLGTVLPTTALAQTVEIPFVQQFQLLGNRYPGCSVTQQAPACAAVPSDAQIEVTVLTGRASVQMSASDEPRCVIISARLWVDHGGPDSNLCYAQLAAAKVRVRFTPTLASPSP